MKNPPKIAFIMDSLDALSLKKDSTLAMIHAAQSRNWQISYLGIEDLCLHEGVVHALLKPLQLVGAFAESSTFPRAIRSRERRYWCPAVRVNARRGQGRGSGSQFVSDTSKTPLPSIIALSSDPTRSMVWLSPTWSHVSRQTS